MALNVKAAVTTAGAFGKNKTLQALLKIIQQYNSLSPSVGLDVRGDVLHMIARTAGAYLTSKPPQNSQKNKERWEGLKDLLEQVGPEAQKWGLRLLSGPADYKKIGTFDNNSKEIRSYWLELLDPHHRPGFKLASLFQSWLTNTIAIQTKQSFWKYIGSETKGAELKGDVGYLGEIVGGREKYLIEIHSTGDVTDAEGHDYSTRSDKTVFSGSGWAIWVCSPTGEVYAGSHIQGKLHHSSFLGGRPVMAAGELCVDAGTIKMITAKSGHYTPSAEDLLNFVFAFSGIPASVIIRPSIQEKKCFYVGEFRENGMNATPLYKDQIFNGLPTWAHTNEVGKEYASVPPSLPPRNPPPRPPRPGAAPPPLPPRT